MYVLRSSPASPFGRKVKIAAMATGVLGLFEVRTADTNDASDSLRHENPLGKIPCLVLPDGTTLYDSRVISEFVDTLTGGQLTPGGARRFDVLTRQALADGIMDAAILLRYEGLMREPGERSAKWVAHQQGKIDRGLAALEAQPPGETLDLGTIAVACALGYLDLRFEGAWRATHPKLVAWLEGFAARVPAFEATMMKA